MNWKQLITEIQEFGWTQAEIGKKCGTSQSTISSLVNRKDGEPTFSLGAALIELHKAVTTPAPEHAEAAL